MGKNKNSAENETFWNGFRPSGGGITERLSPFTKDLAASYLKGEIGRGMKDAEYALFPSGLSEFVDWSAEWYVAGPLEKNGVDPETPTETGIVPDSIGCMEDALSLPGLLENRVVSVNGIIDLAKVFNIGLKHDACLCFTGVTAASAGMLPVVVSCDWWYSVFVNGRLVYSGLGDVPALVELPLEKGENLVVFRITGGKGGWSVSLARRKEILPLNAAPVKIFEIAARKDVIDFPGISPVMDKAVSSLLNRGRFSKFPAPEEVYAACIRKIAESAPLRIIPGEKLAGAATLKDAKAHRVPIINCKSVSHTTLGFEKALSAGYKGLRAEIETRLKEGGLDREGVILLNAMLSCIESAGIWHKRYLNELSALERAASGSEKNMFAGVIESLSNVPENPPKNFREALQSLWLLWDFQRLCGNWSGIGRIDKMLGPYLKKDLAEGALTLDEARELLAHFWIKGCEWVNGEVVATGDAQYYQNIILGGVDEEGKEVLNEVTWLVLDVVEELHISDFPIAVRVSKNTGEKLLRRVAEIQRLGGGIIAIYNEDRVIANLVKFGYPLDEARNFANDGCWEILVPGKTCFSYGSNDMLQALQECLGILPEGLVPVSYDSFDGLYDVFTKKMEEKILRQNRSEYLPLYPVPTVLVDLLVEGCVRKGRSYYNLGPVYTVRAPHAGGLPDAANSLLVIKKLVFDDLELTLPQFSKILWNNWEGYEPLRQKIRSTFDFYGNDAEQSNLMMKKVFDTFTGIVGGLPKEDGILHPAGISTFERVASVFRAGRAASAAGSKKGDILAVNFSPSPGTDKRGPTAVIKSHCAVDFSKLPNGTALELKLFPPSVAGEAGLSALAGLMKTFVSLGGIFMQIDAIDTELLRDAQEHPEKYPNLAVRVSGWSARFATLNKEMQEMIIVRTEQNKF